MNATVSLLHPRDSQIYYGAKLQPHRRLRLPYPDGPSDGPDDEPPGRFGLRLFVWSVLVSVLLMLRRAEGTRDLYVSLVQGDLLSFKVGFLIQHPAGGSRNGDGAYFSRTTSAASPLAYLHLLILLTVHINVKVKNNERTMLVRLSGNPSETR